VKTHFSAFSDDHEVRGATIIGYKSALNSEEFAFFFESRGLKEVDPEGWYPAQNVMDVFNDMLDASHGFLDFVSIGISTAPNLRFPPSVDLHSAESVLTALSMLPNAMIRSSKPGYISADLLNNQHYVIKARSAMPDDMLYGILYALTKGFVSNPATIVLSYPPDGKRRDYGDEYTDYELKWS
jgi:hypothetical protein